MTHNPIAGFIAGCFDGFHEGHQYILKTAMEQCDILHVALNSDRYIIKNKRLLLSCIDERKNKIRNFGVNEIHSFIEDSPIDLINKIKPKIIFVGDDYPLEKVVGHKECKYWGGEVRIIKRIPGFSSTNIRQKNT
tara:strand:- start:855 stop:1259 length:405 start_codon:yes stop_codon:yes gene_type:complete